MGMIAQFFKNGGVVMYPLLGLSIIAVAMILERSLFGLRFLTNKRQLLKKPLPSIKKIPKQQKYY